MKWWEKPVRMMRQDYISDLLRMKDSNLDDLARSKKEDWHINCEWVIATPGIAPGLGYQATFNDPKCEKFAPLGDWDMIREYLPYARKYGIHVLAYTDMHWFAFDFADKHTDWEQRLEDGQAYGRVHPLYGTGSTFCINSPWRDWAYDTIRACMRTGIDGVFLDGPVMFPGGCYCEHCRKKFKDQYGAELPSWGDWSNPLWKDFVDFREESMADFLRDAQKACLEVNPEGVIFLNAGSWQSGSWQVARAVEKVGPYENFNGAESFFHPGTNPETLMWAACAKHLMGGGKPTVVFSHHALGSWHYIPLPEAEVKMSVAQTVACGANPWLAVFDYALDAGKEEAIKPYNDSFGFIERNEQFFTDTKSASKVALLYSRTSSIFYLSSLNIYAETGSGREQALIADLGSGKIVTDWQARKTVCDSMQGAGYIGWFNALTRGHVPFDVLLDNSINLDKLSEYSTLILPNSACLTDEQIAAIKQFVENGGSLIASFETGWYDERGIRRESNPLADVLGYEKIDGVFPVQAIEEYLKVKKINAATEEFREGQYLPRPVYSLKVEPKADREAPIVYMNTIGALYTAPKGESTIPALLLGKYGKGHVAYFPNTLEDSYGKLQVEDHRKLLTQAVKWADPDADLVHTNAPGTVEIELRTQNDGKRVLVHLVNNTGDMIRPVTQLLPIYDLKIQIRMPEASRAYRLSNKKAVPFTCEGRWVNLSIDKLTDYEVIAIESD